MYVKNFPNVDVHRHFNLSLRKHIRGAVENDSMVYVLFSGELKIYSPDFRKVYAKYQIKQGADILNKSGIVLVYGKGRVYLLKNGEMNREVKYVGRFESGEIKGKWCVFLTNKFLYLIDMDKWNRDSIKVNEEKLYLGDGFFSPPPKLHLIAIDDTLIVFPSNGRLIGVNLLTKNRHVLDSSGGNIRFIYKYGSLYIVGVQYIGEDISDYLAEIRLYLHNRLIRTDTIGQLLNSAWQMDKERLILNIEDKVFITRIPSIKNSSIDLFVQYVPVKMMDIEDVDKDGDKDIIMLSQKKKNSQIIALATTHFKYLERIVDSLYRLSLKNYALFPKRKLQYLEKAIFIANFYNVYSTKKLLTHRSKIIFVLKLREIIMISLLMVLIILLFLIGVYLLIKKAQSKYIISMFYEIITRQIFTVSCEEFRKIRVILHNNVPKDLVQVPRSKSECIGILIAIVDDLGEINSRGFVMSMIYYLGNILVILFKVRSFGRYCYIVLVNTVKILQSVRDYRSGYLYSEIKRRLYLIKKFNSMYVEIQNHEWKTQVEGKDEQISIESDNITITDMMYSVCVPKEVVNSIVDLLHNFVLNGIEATKRHRVENKVVVSLFKFRKYNNERGILIKIRDYGGGIEGNGDITEKIQRVFTQGYSTKYGKKRGQGLTSEKLDFINKIGYIDLWTLTGKGTEWKIYISTRKIGEYLKNR